MPQQAAVVVGGDRRQLACIQLLPEYPGGEQLALIARRVGRTVEQMVEVVAELFEQHPLQQGGIGAAIQQLSGDGNGGASADPLGGVARLGPGQVTGLHHHQGRRGLQPPQQAIPQPRGRLHLAGKHVDQQLLEGRFGSLQPQPGPGLRQLALAMGFQLAQTLTLGAGTSDRAKKIHG